MPASRDDDVYQAKLAEQAERYEEMVDSMKKVAKTDQELTVEERNLLSVAYKNLIGSRRASWRIITNIESKEENKSENSKLGLIKKYRSQVRIEIKKNKTTTNFFSDKSRSKKNYVIFVKIFLIYLIKIFFQMQQQAKVKFSI